MRKDKTLGIYLGVISIKTIFKAMILDEIIQKICVNREEKSYKDWPLLQFIF